MTHWPKSLPDYRWPDHYMTTGMKPLRLALAGAFHLAYAAGRAVGAMMQRLMRYEAPPTLVIRPDGIGDALLFEPALESLARTVSPSEVHLWAPAATCDLFAECPSITRRLIIPRGGKEGNLNYFKSIYWRMRLGFELGRWSFEKVVYPVQSAEPLGNWLFASARAEDRWISFGDIDNQFDWQQNQTHEIATRVLESRPGNAHELARNEYLSDQWSEEAQLRKPRVHVNAKANEAAGRLVSAWRRTIERSGASELVGIIVGASSRVKQYPADEWAQVIRRLWDDHGTACVLIGGASDRAEMDKISALLGRVPHLRLTRQLSLLTISSIIRRLDGVLSVDTGLAHISLSMRVPTVVLVGGGHPGRFFPWPGNQRHIALNVPMECEGCKHRCHLSDPHCITRIRSDEIVDALMNLRGAGSRKQSLVLASEVKRRAAG